MLTLEQLYYFQYMQEQENKENNIEPEDTNEIYSDFDNTYAAEVGHNKEI